MPVKILVSGDARGDCVALFCRWLGFEIVRGDAQRGGWKALTEMVKQVHNGAAALIIPDGGGPPFFARIGAAALASAAGRPLIPVGADCRPSVFERHKWDKPRNPLPYGRIAVACGEPLTFPRFEDAVALEKPGSNSRRLWIAPRSRREALLASKYPASRHYESSNPWSRYLVDEYGVRSRAVR
jgi:lysophospholipid acyltransferase (LPLAT)-like uncharacterized protein